MTSELRDQAERDRVVLERERSVIATAGAGTGKTYTLVTRLLELVAPRSDQAPLPLERLAAITFTRRAAGELKLQIQKRLSTEAEGAEGARRERLLAARAALGSAFIGTIHSFSLRLLQSRPVETGLGPAFDVADDEEPLLAWTAAELLRLVQCEEPERLAAAAEQPAVGRALEVIRVLLQAGVPAVSRGRYRQAGSLNTLVRALVALRGAPLAPADWPEPAALPLFPTIAEIGSATDQLSGPSFAAQILRQMALDLRAVGPESGPLEILGQLVRAFRRLERLPRSKSHPAFAGDDLAWALAKALRDEPFKKTKSSAAFADRYLWTELSLEAFVWAAGLLLGLAPAALALYEGRKRAQGVIDQTDLLQKLRDALRDRQEFRDSCRALFDHILVDECQDTDPLQMDILALLTADESGMPRPGAITVVGDPKQSIYAFRRADIRAFGRFLGLLESSGAVTCSLSANFRSRPELVEGVFNARGAALLGSEAGPGRAPYAPLTPSGRVPPAPGPVVHRLRFGLTGRRRADEWRAYEAEAIADHLEALLRQGFAIRDPESGALRPVKPADVAVLCHSTRHTKMLTTALDQRGLPSLARGGASALSEPLVGKLLLALRALSDPDDGPARAVLLSPPFFGLSLDDRLCSRSEAALAEQVLHELRDGRHRRPFAETARALIERTGLGPGLVIAPNGLQRLSLLAQVVAALQRRADETGFDFDRLTALGRSFVAEPPRFDPAEADGVDGVRLFTIHQAKGLEFPVVVLWDALHKRRASDRPALLVAEDRRGFHLKLMGIEADTTSGALGRETAELELLEQDRLVYVAITRARDLLVIPEIRGQASQSGLAYNALLLQDLSESVVQTFEAGPVSAALPPPPAVVAAPEEHDDLEAALARARLPDLAPAAPSRFAGESAPAPAEDEAVREPDTSSRHGPAFGSLVHRTLELFAQSRDRRGAFQAALAEWPNALSDEAWADVGRAIEALERSGLLGPDVELLPELPLGGAWRDETGRYLVAGQTDLVAASKASVTVVDYKTDRTPALPAAAPRPADRQLGLFDPPAAEDARTRHHEAQIRLYGELLRQSGLLGGREVHLILLYTETGLVWPVRPSGL